MTDQEEKYQHFNLCMDSLKRSLDLLQEIRIQKYNSITIAAFQYALIEYCKPYKISNGFHKQYRLDDQFVPNEYSILHKNIIGRRDQILAHSDLTVLEAKISVHSYIGQKGTTILKKNITGVEDIPNLDAIISLIEGTLANMSSELIKMIEDLPSYNE